MKKRAFCVWLLLASCSFSLGQTEKVLYAFTGLLGDGSNPLGGLVADSTGNLYGTTKFGGVNIGNVGTVFELSPNLDGTWTEAVLYSFCSNQSGVLCIDGAEPYAGLVLDSVGNLYGTTYGGGSSLNCQNPTFGCGTVFELSPPSVSGSRWTETVLYNFCSVGGSNCTDGAFPVSSLARDGSGNLYGTTEVGGTGSSGYGVGTNGLVFELSPGAGGWTETVLYNFCPKGQGSRFCPDGSYPVAGVTLDHAGNLYGTTEFGGASGARGGGVIYELLRASDWAETVLAATRPPYVIGEYLLGTVSFAAGNVYTTAQLGGKFSNGSVFTLNPYSKKSSSFSFDGGNGSEPAAGVLVDAFRHTLYGTTASGGTNNNGGGTFFGIWDDGLESEIYSFCQQPNCVDGLSPVGNLIEDVSGNLYGVTAFGGANNSGVVFEITP